MEYQNMPVPQPARSPLAADPHLQERVELITRKYAGGLRPHESQRLTEIEDYLDSQDIAKADLISARGGERMARIDEMLDRVESAIQDLKASKLN
jgi:hypothetical protein